MSVPVPVPVLVLNRDGRRFLEPCFESLAREAARDPLLEPWLVDNGSRDGSVDLVRARFPAVRVVALGDNLGFAGAYDRVLRDDALLAERPLVVLLNNDVRVGPDFLAPLVTAMADADVALAGSRLLSGDGRRVDHAGGQVALIGGGVDIGKFAPAPAGPPAPAATTGFACGGALCVRRSAYLALGGFDPAYVIYHEDVDLGWRAWLMGWRVLHVPTSVVYHEGGALMGRPDDPRRLFLSQRNRLRNLIRLSGPRRLLEGLAVSACFDLVRTGGFAWHRDGARLRALLAADRDVVLELPALLRARRELQRRRVRDDRELARAGVFASFGASVRAYFAQRAAAAQ
ncbi:MAG: glycosyltransferase family 2 protein [Deltaproteobacteria bacterium]|nr:glycosyltransferase family 2 protein [Deltaproteobacteria bacterium]